MGFTNFILNYWFPEVINTLFSENIDIQDNFINILHLLSHKIQQPIQHLDLEPTQPPKQKELSEILQYLAKISEKCNLKLKNYPVSKIWTIIPSRCSFTGPSSITVGETTTFTLRTVRCEDDQYVSTDECLEIMVLKYSVENDNKVDINFNSEALGKYFNSKWELKDQKGKKSIDIDLKITGISVGGCPFQILLREPSKEADSKEGRVISNSNNQKSTPNRNREVFQPQGTPKKKSRKVTQTNGVGTQNQEIIKQEPAQTKLSTRNSSQKSSKTSQVNYNYGTRSQTRNNNK